MSRRQFLLNSAGLAAVASLPTAALAAETKPASPPVSQTNNQGKQPMNKITTKDSTEIYYKDWGSGPVVTFSHGWPLTADAWEAQMFFFGFARLSLHRPSALNPQRSALN